MDLKAFKSKYEHKPVIESFNIAPKKPMVSVCVQTYQHVDFIEACLEGILQQETNFEFEILLGEDASTDGTRAICEKYAEEYPDKIRLFLHHRENNIKIGGKPTGRFNFIYNLISARGEYIALCEGDDYWIDPLKLQKQVDFLRANSEFNLHCTASKIKKGDDFILTNKKSQKITASHIFENNDIVTASVVLRKCSITIPSYIYESPAADWIVFLFAIKNSLGFYSSDITCVYRIHEGGIWASYQEKNDSASIERKYTNLLKNIYIYECIKKDQGLAQKIREYSDTKIESYLYQAKKAEIENSFLKDRYSSSVYPHRLKNKLKLLIFRIKTLL